MEKGVIIKGIGGFYYVQTDSALIECKARGKFKNAGQVPVAGDRVLIEIQRDVEKPENADGAGVIERIEPRKNVFVRPAVANVDQFIITIAARAPLPDLALLDKLTVRAVKSGVDAAVCLNKLDLDSEKYAAELKEIYEKAGFSFLEVSALEKFNLDALEEKLKGKVSALCGASGVGKTSLLNGLCGFGEAVGAVSRKIERGRHTTRQATLFPLPFGGFALDTPGFSVFEIDDIAAGDLARYFPEMAPHTGACRFAGCAHLREPDCAVRAALEKGEIAPSRYENYVALYETLKAKKRW